MDQFKNNSLYITIILILFLLILSIFNYFGMEITIISWLEMGVYNIISPLIEITSALYNRVLNNITIFFRMQQLIEENRELTREVGLLETRIHQLESSLRQQERLQRMEDFMEAFQDFKNYQATGASVIGYGPSNWEDRIIINKGSRDGIKTNMPVISYNGVLVGHISNTGLSTSQILPVNNGDFAVGVIVERSRDLGLVRGQANNPDINIMENIEADADLVVGDRILTSGLSENFPKYLPVGEVKSIETDDYGLSKKAEIEVYFRRHTLEEVLIITDF